MLILLSWLQVQGIVDFDQCMGGIDVFRFNDPVKEGSVSPCSGSVNPIQSSTYQTPG